MKNVPLGVLDFETDPFVYGRIPFPFACGIYFGASDSYRVLWNTNTDKLIDATVSTLKALRPCILYAHNGGKFDFSYLVEYANETKCLVRNGRIFEMRLGNVLLRDSWPLMPFALEEYRKTAIDYSLFEADRRDEIQTKLRIQSYLYDDCKNLYDLILGFRQILGPKDTIGSAAFYQMRKLGIEIESLNETHDEQFRQYFHGGRVQAFQRGIFNGNYRYVDRNSAYSFAMLHDHAHGADYKHSNRLPKAASSLGPCFVTLQGFSRGALPSRAVDGSLDFPVCDSTFHTTGWEVIAGLETGTLEIERILDCWIPQNTISFAPFVETFYPLKDKSKREGDKIAYLAYKYLLNSGYGKFAQNPRDFKEYTLYEFGEYPPGKDWEWETDYGSVSLWSKPNYDGFGFFDVATGASITGFTRAGLWRGACASSDLLYCDTDAILAGNSRVPISSKLGEWKLEGIASECCIAGKKLYALKAEIPCFDGETTKIASKGARLSYAQVKSMCQGKTVTWKNQAPTFSATLGAHFVKRKLRMTGE